MLLELDDNDDRSVELKIKEEDISILYIVQHELLKNKNIEFAGVVLKHQLMKDYILRIISKGTSAMETLQKSVDSGIKEIENIKQILDSQFKSKGESDTAWSSVQHAKAEWNQDLMKEFWFVRSVDILLIGKLGKNLQLGQQIRQAHLMEELEVC